MGFRILLVEDETKIAQSIKRGLEEQGYETTIANDGIEAKILFQQNHYDLVVLDINLPRLDGYSLCKDLRLTNAQLPILMLTAMGSTEQKLEGFSAGADDYLVKPFEFRELVARIGALLKRTTVEDDKEISLSFADIKLNLTTKIVTRSGNNIVLTAKEFQLLEYFMRNSNKVLSRADIAKEVWGIDFDTQTNMIDVYMTFLRKKIDKNFPVKLLRTYVRMGYILTDKEEM